MSGKIIDKLWIDFYSEILLLLFYRWSWSGNQTF